MKKFAAPLTLAFACIAYGLVVVCDFYFAAQVQGETRGARQSQGALMIKPGSPYDTVIHGHRTDLHGDGWDRHRVRSEGNSKRPDGVQVRGYSTVRTAPTSKRCGFMEVWGDLGRRTTGRNRQAVCGRP